ncbi:YbgA family protein [Vibrio cortegadensis]|uniref:YbgA family protein n=1 Tax=Vibrio cortegadensis TaxID=1328770 RepID=A0ABV4M336_9VIBR
MSHIEIGVSACIIGNPVRFDGGSKLNHFLARDLVDYFSFVPVCPEVSIGMPTPRPAIRLVSDEERIRLLQSQDSSKDHTDNMIQFSKQKVQDLGKKELCGYVVCANSPTCGMERVKVYQGNQAQKNGVGLFTQELMEQMPWLPVEEDGRLQDPVLRENFITRVYSLRDFYDSMGGDPTPGKIVAFHSRYKLSLMAHHPESYKLLGRLVAHIKDYDENEFYQRYRTEFMQAIRNRASRKNNTNVLMHIQGYFKTLLTGTQKAELCRVIDQYRTGLLPILAPLTLINHYLEAFPDSYLLQQKYLQPYPQELGLRYAL